MSFRKSPNSLRGAFTLIEVLISVLILALGLLGLGSLFPAIISQQKEGAEATQGVLAANSATSMVSGSNLATVSPSIWGTWRSQLFENQSFGAQAQTEQAQGAWTVPSLDIRGGVELGGNAATRVVVPVAQRLYPNRAGSTPMFVWDIGIHRKAQFDAGRRDRLEMAVFLRRIDARIRQPRRANAPSIFQMITHTAPDSSDFRFPVAIARDRLTRNGEGDYATLMTADVDFRFDEDDADLRARNRLYMEPSVDNATWAFLSQRGQKLVDNLGHVFNVESSSQSPAAGPGNGGGGTGARYVVISPPMPRAVLPTSAAAGGGAALVPARVVQVLFAPDVPVSVELIEIQE